MTEFRTTATHDGRAVPMPHVDASKCDEFALCHGLWKEYRDRVTESTAQDLSDLRARILADALASTAPSEDAIRAAKWDAMQEVLEHWRNYLTIHAMNGASAINPVDELLTLLTKKYAPRPVYAAPVVLGNGDTFGQTGPDKFTRTLNKGSAFDASAQYWRDCNGFRPADGALVLSVLDGAERAR
jgi:hypothetical protein